MCFIPQQPWIFSASVRDNILLGSKLDREEYSRVISVCGLSHDIKQWEEGDATFVGERGLSLSGGQKARIALARAAYRVQDFDVFLLDDPLSAVDKLVGDHIFSNCIKKHFAKKTVLMSSHNYRYVEEGGQLLVVESGHLVYSGKHTGVEVNEFLPRRQLSLYQQM